MIILLSPAKRLDYKIQVDVPQYSTPGFIDESAKLMNSLKKLSANKIKNLMNINNDLASLNYDRFQNWAPDFNLEVAKPAIMAFKGDAYLGLDAPSYSNEDLDFAQSNLRILSGLHGILKPLDLIRPYRLEMGTKIKIGRAKNLYEFWQGKIYRTLADEPAFKKDKIIINLASAEYFKAVDTQKMGAKVITPTFKEHKDNGYLPVHVFLKKARGLMTSYIIKNRIHQVEDIKLFDWEGYLYNDLLSKENEWVFTRG